MTLILIDTSLVFFVLELNRTRDEIAQARTHTQGHLINACLALPFVAHFQLGSYKQYGVILLHYGPSLHAYYKLIPFSIHSYECEQSNAQPSTLSDLIPLVVSLGEFEY